MSFDSTHLITISGVATPITAFAPCSGIILREDPSVAGWPTTALLLSQPLADSQAVRFNPGEPIEFHIPRGERGYRFHAGEVVGYIKTQTGASTTLSQREVPG
jgi:hypothetical protein